MRNPYSETISTPVLENVINANEYFSPGKAHTISDLYEENNISTDSLRKLGVLTTLWINSEPLGWREIYYGNRTEGKDAYGFASALDLFNINQVLSTIYSQKGSEASIIRSRILFSLLSKNADKLQGIVLVGKTAQSEEVWDARIVKTIKNSGLSWLYTKDGKLVSADEVSKYDLDENIYGKILHGSRIYEVLGFVETEIDKKIDTVVKIMHGDSTIKDDLLKALIEEKYGILLSDLDKMLINEGIDIQPTMKKYEYYTAPEVEDDFPSRPVHDFNRLVRMIEQTYSKAAPVRYEERMRKVRTSEQPDLSKSYVRSMYGFDADAGVFACQMCEDGYHDKQGIK